MAWALVAGEGGGGETEREGECLRLQQILCRPDSSSARVSSLRDLWPIREKDMQMFVIGSGSFGMVYSAKLYDSNEDVAIKKVYQDKRFKKFFQNRELQIMRRLEHPNIVRLMYYYFAAENAGNEEYLYLVLEFFPKTLHQLYMFQLFRGLSFMSSLNICHRDIKPHNLLVNPERGTLRICDFGSAKITRGANKINYLDRKGIN
ncbi:unnamed protein product [Strongylus vulgaris]|uniref:Protein kinase domain-containing protein n=1 Tax=Strongylus vulgaris TaxID=40348 RepID=A0A3P7LDS0_STRVU|nr:unnamed protein product [Strongylus vulgaris]